MFKVNDYVMHGGNGVCQIVKIGGIDLYGANKDRLYYTLMPVFGRGSMIYTPMDSEKTVIRALISKNEAMGLLESFTKAECIQVTDEKLRENAYKEAIKSYECDKWLGLIKTIYMRKEERENNGKKITSLDERYLKLAKEYLFGELSIVLETEKDKLEKRMSLILY